MATLTPLTATGNFLNAETITHYTYDGIGDPPWNSPVNTVTDATELADPITSSVANGDTAFAILITDVGTFTKSMDLSAVDSDFANMVTLGVRFSAWHDGYTGWDDLQHLSIVVRKQSNGTILAAYSSGGTEQDLLRYSGAGDWSDTSAGGTGQAPTYDTSVTFGYVDTAASKSDWDNAVAWITWSHTRVMASDYVSIWLVDFELTGTYTAAATGFDAPANFTAVLNADPTKADLAWDAATDATGYDIERNSSIIVNDHQTLTYQDSGLSGGTQYDYRVRTRDDSA